MTLKFSHDPISRKEAQDNLAEQLKKLNSQKVGGTVTDLKFSDAEQNNALPA